MPLDLNSISSTDFHFLLLIPERVAPVFPPPVAIPLTNEAPVTNDVPLFGVPIWVPAAAALLDMPMTGMLVTPLATEATAPAEPAAFFVIVTELPAPFTKVATDFDRLPPVATLALLAALITAAWFAATSREWCWEDGFPVSAACTEKNRSP